MFKQRILVTGGAGYIGSHVCKKLSKSGAEILVLDNLSTGFRENVMWSEFVCGDLLNKELISQTLRKFKPHGVMHFAGYSNVAESELNPMKYYLNNVSGSINLISTMLEENINNLIFSSTCAVYGIPTSDRILESDPKFPINAYGHSKLMVENILKQNQKLNKFKYVVLRYFNAAGADLDGEITENHHPETHLIPLAIQSALDGSKLKVYGGDYETPDGTAIRDFVHVEDLAEAHIESIKFLQTRGICEEFNLGSSNPISVLEVINGLKEFGLTPNYEIVERRAGDAPILIADSSKAKSILNWTAKTSSLNSILNSVISAKNLLAN